MRSRQPFGQYVREDRGQRRPGVAHRGRNAVCVPGHGVDEQGAVEIVVAALARGLGREQARVAGRAVQHAAVARVVLGAQRV